jgi:protein-disulfide isomerase
VSFRLAPAAALAAAFTFAAGALALAGPAPDQGAMSIELFIRRLEGVPASVKIEVGAPQPSAVAGLDMLPLTIGDGPRMQRTRVYRSADGRYLMVGPLLDLSKDPFAEAASRLDLKDRPTVGRSDAAITVVEYSSFQCPYCRRLAAETKPVLASPVGKDVRWVFKHFPLESQKWSEPAAVAGECARGIGGNAKFWQLHDLYFQQQDQFTAENHRQRVVEWARRAGLSASRFERCLADPKTVARVRADQTEARSLGIDSTPTLVINGRVVPGARTSAELRHLLETELQYQRALARASGG